MLSFSLLSRSYNQQANVIFRDFSLEEVFFDIDCVPQLFKAGTTNMNNFKIVNMFTVGFFSWVVGSRS